MSERNEKGRDQKLTPHDNNQVEFRRDITAGNAGASVNSSNRQKILLVNDQYSMRSVSEG